jgi:integrase
VSTTALVVIAPAATEPLDLRLAQLRQMVLDSVVSENSKRNYAILALLVGCALRRQELAELEVEKIQMRERRWVIADLRGKGGRIGTVAIPMWVKHATPG